MVEVALACPRHHVPLFFYDPFREDHLWCHAFALQVSLTASHGRGGCGGSDRLVPTAPLC